MEEHRAEDEHTRRIVHLTVHEIFDGVGVDFSTPEGRQKFRDTIQWATEWHESALGVKKGGYVAVGAAMLSGFIWLVMNGVKGIAVGLKALAGS